MKKTLKIVGIAVVVLVVLLVVIAIFSIDRILKAGIERGGTYALGVPTRADSASISFMKGQVGVGGLMVGNPDGYKTPHFMHVGRVDVIVEPGTLTTDSIVVTRFEIDGLDLNIEHGSDLTNVQAILKNMESPTAAQTKEAPKGGGRKVKVNKILVKNIVAHVKLLPVGGDAATIDVKIPELALDNVSSEDSGGVALSELIKRVVPAILAAVFEKGKDFITDVDFARMGDDVNKTTKALGEGAAKLSKQAGETLNKAAKDADKAAKDAAESLKKGAEPLQKGLEGLLGGKKKSD
jgi:uncharacterized protein involved in outer membrane biogenesis